MLKVEKHGDDIGISLVGISRFFQVKLFSTLIHKPG